MGSFSLGGRTQPRCTRRWCCRRSRPRRTRAPRRGRRAWGRPAGVRPPSSRGPLAASGPARVPSLSHRTLVQEGSPYNLHTILRTDSHITECSILRTGMTVGMGSTATSGASGHGLIHVRPHACVASHLRAGRSLAAQGAEHCERRTPAHDAVAWRSLGEGAGMGFHTRGGLHAKKGGGRGAHQLKPALVRQPPTSSLPPTLSDGRLVFMLFMLEELISDGGAHWRYIWYQTGTTRSRPWGHIARS